MSSEELSEQIDTAIERAIYGDADLDEIEQVLEQKKQKIDGVRAYREAGQ